LSHAPVVSDVLFRVLSLPERFMYLAQGDKRSVRGEVARAYRYPFRKMADRVAPLATARMAPHRDDHPSIHT
jgi:haloalkane dehalogenase